MSDAVGALCRAEGAVRHVVRDVDGCGVALLTRHLMRAHSGPLVVVVPSSELAQQLAADLRFALSEPSANHASLQHARVVLLDGPAPQPYAQRLPDRRANQRQLATLLRMQTLARPLERQAAESAAGSTAAADEQATLKAAQVVVVAAEQLLRRVPSWPQPARHTEP